MYEAHPVFRQPDDPSIKVWRYMDFTKLVSLIDSRRLYFARVDMLGDPFEGSWPKINVAARTIAPPEVPEDQRENYIRAMANLSSFNKNWPRYNAVSCWHLNEHESAAMWKLYLKSDEGIAVQSTYEKLRDSIVDDEKIYLGLVNYIDYETEFIDGRNMLTPFVHKRKSFAHEQEVRAMATKFPITEGNEGLDFSKDTIIGGLKIRVDVERLIERIHVAPSAPGWFADLVRALVRRYGYEFEVVHSQLNERPVF